MAHSRLPLRSAPGRLKNRSGTHRPDAIDDQTPSVV